MQLEKLTEPKKRKRKIQDEQKWRRPCLVHGLGYANAVTLLVEKHN
jgi:hypothetical protein